jgi:hypothetical protein
MMNGTKKTETAIAILLLFSATAMGPQQRRSTFR